MLQILTYTLNTEIPEINIDGLNDRYSQVCVYNSNQKENDKKNSENDFLIAIDSITSYTAEDQANNLNTFQAFLDNHKHSWLFGYLSYDLKNEFESLSSKNSDHLQFPLMHFFVPKFVIQIKKKCVTIFYDPNFSTEKDAKFMCDFTFSKSSNSTIISDKLISKKRISKENYLSSVNALKHQIQIGNIYEINFCQEFYIENVTVDPSAIYNKLNTLSNAPFSAFCKFSDHYLISSSPERFLKKQGNKLISQPIKGTIKRSSNPLEDDELKTSLKNNLKEQNENVMIVDIVRNDLSKIAKKGSVQVDELFEVYSFQQVHQLISTISCDLKSNTQFSDIIRATFPMGSMTGAPKISAMKLIEEFESTKRGLYSGAIGFIDPNGDFDFSVVIRSILYNKKNKYLSFMTGSAITNGSEAEVEYEECLLKAKALIESIELPN